MIQLAHRAVKLAPPNANFFEQIDGIRLSIVCPRLSDKQFRFVHPPEKSYEQIKKFVISTPTNYEHFPLFFTWNTIVHDSYMFVHPSESNYTSLRHFARQMPLFFIPFYSASILCLFLCLYICLYVWFKSGNSNLFHFQLSNCLETLQACVVWMTIQYF